MSGLASLPARLSILPLVVLLVAVISYGGFGLGRDTTVPTHSLRNAGACLDCHVSFEDFGLQEPVPALCGKCHPIEGLSARDGHSRTGEAHTPEGPACRACHDVHGKTREPFLLWPEVAGD